MDQPARPLDALEQRGSQIEALIDVMPGIDPWCSLLDWVVPCHHAFAPESEPLIASEDGTGEAILARYHLPDGSVAIAGLEPLWGFACPLLTTDAEAMADLLVETLDADAEWRFVMLSGMPRTQLTATIGRQLGHLGAVGYGEGITRQIADLRGGADEWFARRSSRFRKQLRSAARRAEDSGIELVDASHDPALFERCQRIEEQSWKGGEGDGICSPTMSEFYRRMLERLAPQHRIRATVAQLDGKDVGFIFGGVRNGRYRGLQLSFAESVRHLSVSHLLQHHTIEQLATESEPVHTYDLGMDMDYKRRWADHEDTSVVIIVDRHPRH